MATGLPIRDLGASRKARQALNAANPRQPQRGLKKVLHPGAVGFKVAAQLGIGGGLQLADALF